MAQRPVTRLADRLPTFLVIGAGKAGTTSLHHYLGQHPQIFMSPVKEPKFFALAGHALDFNGPGDERIRIDTTVTLEAYRKLFERVHDETAIGESSTLYLNHEDAPDAIARHLPDVKLIAILRDPAARAYSAFQHLTRDGYEPLRDFDEALRAEPERKKNGWYYYWWYRDRGYYHRDLRRYFDRFAPDQIRVYLHDELDRDPQGVLADIFRFLGVDAGFRPDVRVRHNVSGQARSARLQRVLRSQPSLRIVTKRVIPERWGHRLASSIQGMNLERPPLDVRTRARLVEGYVEDVRRLEGLIGRDLSHWLR